MFQPLQPRSPALALTLFVRTGASQATRWPCICHLGTRKACTIAWRSAVSAMGQTSTHAVPLPPVLLGVIALFQPVSETGLVGPGSSKKVMLNLFDCQGTHYSLTGLLVKSLPDQELKTLHVRLRCSHHIRVHDLTFGNMSGNVKTAEKTFFKRPSLSSSNMAWPPLAMSLGTNAPCKR